ncbi:MAG TPA: glycosyltransferase [Steroidobacteraceae bacterium]|nr:glycosyltransferase [Steroidobacteraceae bacterium]
MSTVAIGPVVFVLSQLGVGGSEAKTVRLANSLAERGIDVTIAYLSAPETLASAVGPGVTLVNLRRRGKLSIPAVRRLAALLEARRARTVVAINLYAALYARLAQLTRAAADVHFIACVNTSEILARDRAKMPLYRWILRRADAVVFGAASQRQLWRQRHAVGVPPQATAVLYNGVDTSHFAPHREDGERACVGLSTRFLIGTVARLRPEKAHTDLIRATAALRARGLDVGALVVGEGEARVAIEAEIARLGLEPYVELAGESGDVRAYLQCLDIFVLTSIAVETFSNAALEAMACGLPIVSSDIGGMPELLAHGGGLSYTAGDVPQLTERLASLLEDPDSRQHLATQARRAVVEHFSWDRMVEEFLALLASSAAGRDHQRAVPAARRQRESDFKHRKKTASPY